MHQLGQQAITLNRVDADFSHPPSLTHAIEALRPSAIINAAAYTAVDQAESDERNAFAVNAESPRMLAMLAKAQSIPFIHYSTDYVFDGEGRLPRDEDNPTAPLNVYGRSKRAGEEAIESIGGDTIIFRTSWVYDAWGKNFLTTMLRLGAERETLSIVADQIGAPTYAPHLAEQTLNALKHAKVSSCFPSGIYHLCHAGEVSWHGFAEAIFTQARTLGLPLKVTTLNAIASSEYPTPAKRPLNSRLNCQKAAEQLHVALPDWQQGLQEALEQVFSHRTAHA